MHPARIARWVTATLAACVIAPSLAAADDYALPLMGITQRAETVLHAGWERIGTLRGRLGPDGRAQRIRFK